MFLFDIWYENHYCCSILIFLHPSIVSFHGKGEPKIKKLKYYHIKITRNLIYTYTAVCYFRLCWIFSRVPLDFLHIRSYICNDLATVIGLPHKFKYVLTP